ncbi:MAG: FAD binding domain-containing protein [Anaerolineales bacterium]|nr:FAD binding domain-containing protein [Anaerolineales bacterium]
MQQLKSYHRPDSVEAVLSLLDRPDVKTTVIGGGTSLVATLPEEVEEVVDLQAVGLTAVVHTPDRMTIGAMVRLQSLVADKEAPELLRRMAHREGPNTFRNAASLGGVLVDANSESELLAALLVFEAVVSVQTSAGGRQKTLPDFLADVAGSLDGGLVTAVSLKKSGQTAHARVARTPQDKPIVAALARKAENGDVLLALCGVGETAVLVDPTALDTLNPTGDFRGSSVYRKQMAAVLSERILNELS